MNKMYLLFFLMLFLLVGACTEVELFDDSSQSRRTQVQFSFDWVTNAPQDAYDHHVSIRSP